MVSRIMVLAIAVTLVGCTSVKVRKVEKENEHKAKGFRYYRPKPYLLILPGKAPGGSEQESLELKGAIKLEHSGPVVPPEPAKEEDPNDNPAEDPGDSAFNLRPEPLDPVSFRRSLLSEQDDDMTVPSKVKDIQISLQYLPDLSEEYSVELQPGLGIGEMNLTLDNGWNLTAVNVKTDQQTDEIISSVAQLTESLGGVLDSMSSRTKADNYVPLGLYEAVIARDCHGTKQFYGWRYIGFMPFAHCPLHAKGCEPAHCCEVGRNAVFGLVWEQKGDDSYLVFRKIADIGPDARK